MAFDLRFEAADAAEPANLGGPSESVDHGDSEPVLKQLHTLLVLNIVCDWRVGTACGR